MNPALAPVEPTVALPLVAHAPLAAPSVLDASNVAAAPRPDPQPMRPAVAPEPSLTPRAEVREVLELVWFDSESVPRIRRKAPWRPLLDALERTPVDPDFDDPALAKSPLHVEERREVFEILARAEPIGQDELYDVLGRCVRDDGKFVPTLALLAGEIELPFDELAMLRATLTTVAPLVGHDDALKSAVEAGKDFLATTGLMSAPAVAEGLTKRIEDAFAQGKRVVSAGYLEAQRERALLEQRQYQRRVVFGDKHLRALLDVGDGEIQPAVSKPASQAKASSAGRVPTYVPEPAAPQLPIYPRFRVRLIAEIRLQADRYENHAAALRVLALARGAAPPKR